MKRLVLSVTKSLAVAALVVAAFALLLAQPAAAGERFLGKIWSDGGADTTNVNTLGGNSAPFSVPCGAKLTAWCDAAAFVITDTTLPCVTAVPTAIDSGVPGLPVSANEKFPTSSASSGTARAGLSPDGGTAAQGNCTVRICGAATVGCNFYERLGTE